MPMFEFGCVACGGYQERYLPRASSPNPTCEDPACGGETQRLISGFAITFTGIMYGSKYNDKTKEFAHQDGHWVTEKKTVDGKPRPRFLETFQDQAQYCKQEGLVNPKDLPTNAESTGDRHLSGRGMPGAWN